MKKNFANVLTSARILCGILLLFTSVFSLSFYAVYLFGGFTDMIDGTVARKTGSATSFGEKLDSTADVCFLIAAVIKIVPELNIPGWIWAWTLLILLLRCGNIMRRWRLQRQAALPHSVMNKITGLLLFLLPLTITWIELKHSAFLICGIATLAAVQEWRTNDARLNKK